jgi:hypothetical protein
MVYDHVYSAAELEKMKLAAEQKQFKDILCKLGARIEKMKFTAKQKELKDKLRRLEAEMEKMEFGAEQKDLKDILCELYVEVNKVKELFGKQDSCIHSKTWAKETQTMEIKCELCGQKVVSVGHRFAQCFLQVCEECLNNSNELWGRGNDVRRPRLSIVPYEPAEPPTDQVLAPSPFFMSLAQLASVSNVQEVLDADYDTIMVEARTMKSDGAPISLPTSEAAHRSLSKLSKMFPVEGR